MIRLLTPFIVAAIAAVGMAADSASTQPALPPGHPPISTPAEPDIVGMMRGTTPIPQAQSRPVLPMGHPDISKMPARQGMAPALGARPVNGSLVIRAVQSTAGGAVPAGDTCFVELSSNGDPAGKFEKTLDDKGVLVIDNIMLTAPTQASVTVMHRDIAYRAVSPMLHPASPQAQVEVPVYETIAQRPAQLNVRMRHLMIQPGPEGLQVMDMLSVDNPTDRTFIIRRGEGDRDPTLVLPLPAGATNVQYLLGFDDCCTTVADGRLTHKGGIPPGSAEFRIAYVVPVADGKARLDVAAPIPVKQLRVFVPDDGSRVSVEGLEGAGANKGAAGVVRAYKAVDQDAGQIAIVSLSEIPAVAKAHSAAAAGSSKVAQIVAGVGGALILMLIVGMFFMRGSKSVVKK